MVCRGNNPILVLNPTNMNRKTIFIQNGFAVAACALIDENERS